MKAQRALDESLIREATEFVKRHEDDSKPITVLFYAIQFIKRLSQHLIDFIEDWKAEEIDCGYENNGGHVWYRREDVPDMVTGLRKRIVELEKQIREHKDL